ncbi:hypothetical protein PGB90_002305 [Kerria lacca]
MACGLTDDKPQTARGAFPRYVNYQIVAYSMFNKLPTINPEPEPLNIEDKPRKIDKSNKAMKIYLEKVTQYHKFMVEQRTDFEIGKRHLANMMGRDPENFTQEEIDESIEYLFPSGLFQKKARPMMKPPEEVFPSNKEAQFDVTGRPFHFLFYTTKPNFYQILHDAVKIIKDLNDFQDKVLTGQENNPNFPRIILDTSQWIQKLKLERIVNEKLNDHEYNEFIVTLERIAMHEFGKKAEDFVLKFREFVGNAMNLLDNEKPQLLEDGKQVMVFKDIKRRTIVTDVTITYPGTGKFIIEGQDIRYFSQITCREAVSIIFTSFRFITNLEYFGQIWARFSCTFNSEK